MGGGRVDDMWVENSCESRLSASCDYMYRTGGCAGYMDMDSGLGSSLCAKVVCVRCVSVCADFFSVRLCTSGERVRGGGWKTRRDGTGGQWLHAIAPVP